MEAADTSKSVAGQHPEIGWVWWLSVALAGFLGLLLTLGAPYMFGRGLKAGDIADRDLVATRALTVVDENATKLAQDHAAQSVLPVFKRDHTRDQQILNDLDADLKLVPVLQQQAGLPLA